MRAATRGNARVMTHCKTMSTSSITGLPSKLLHHTTQGISADGNGTSISRHCKKVHKPESTGSVNSHLRFDGFGTTEKDVTFCVRMVVFCTMKVSLNARMVAVCLSTMKGIRSGPESCNPDENHVRQWTSAHQQAITSDRVEVQASKQQCKVHSYRDASISSTNWYEGRQPGTPVF